MIAGVDEAGRGPVIGPLVVAGVMVSDESVLRELKVRDSKKLTPLRRERLDVEIKALARVESHMIPAEEIDILRSEMSLNIIEAKVFATIIERLRPDKVYVDSADVDEGNFRGYIQRELDFQPEIVSKHGADDIYPVVSAASIIAKVARDREIERIKGELGMDIGSGYPSDPKTISFIEKWIEEEGGLPPYTRGSWKTAQRLLAKGMHSSLDDFQQSG